MAVIQYIYHVVYKNMQHLELQNSIDTLDLMFIYEALRSSAIAETNSAGHFSSKWTENLCQYAWKCQLTHMDIYDLEHLMKQKWSDNERTFPKHQSIHSGLFKHAYQILVTPPTHMKRENLTLA